MQINYYKGVLGRYPGDAPELSELLATNYQVLKVQKTTSGTTGKTTTAVHFSGLSDFAKHQFAGKAWSMELREKLRKALTKPFKVIENSLDNGVGTLYLVEFYRISRLYKDLTEQDELKREAVKLLYRSYTDFTSVSEGTMHTERPSTAKSI